MKKKVLKKSVKGNLKKKADKTLKRYVPKYIELKGFLSFFILHELNRKSVSGDELARVIGERRGTVLTPGTIYPALKRLRRQKLIQYRRNGRKKLYILTDLGKKELVALYSVFGDLFCGLKTKLK
ncbi:MAG: PadR family transcriptional regulator [Candidatus Woesearchaeota archaeon]